MVALGQRLTACLLCCLLVGTLRAHAKVVKKNIIIIDTLDYDAIQTKLSDPASAGNVIQLPAGELVLEPGQFFQITQPLQLKGQGPGLTIINSTDPLFPDKKQVAPSISSGLSSCLASDGTDGKAILEICQSTLTRRRSDNSTTVMTVPTTDDPIWIDGITFIYSGVGSTISNPGVVSGSDSYKGIAVKLSGPASSGLGFSSIKNCDFVKADVGVELLAAAKWDIEGNLFEDTPRGVWLNSEPGVPMKTRLATNIISNNFTGFDIGIGCDPDDDLIYDVVISSNTFENDPSASSSPSYYNIGIYLSANIGTDMSRSSPSSGVVHSSVSTAAVSMQQAMPSVLQQPSDELRWDPSPLATIREWVIEYNRFVGVYYAVVFQYDSLTTGMMRAVGSLSGVNVNYNSIQLYSSCTPDTCAAINSLFNSLSGLDATNNWYGSPNPTTSGSSSLFTPTNLDWSAAITPYIRDYDPITPCPTSGFCLDPTTIVLNTDPVPAITSFSFSPATSTPGSSVTAILTLAEMFDGTVTFTSSPAGVSCTSPTAFTAMSANPIRVTCTVPQSVAMMAEAAAAQAAFVQTAAVQYGYGRRRITPAPAGTPTGARQFTVTATVTANAGAQFATQAAVLGVCSNQPWPFRADVQGCEGCTYDCTTGRFSCTSCPCHCPHNGHYAEGGDSYGDKPYGGDSYGDKPYGGDSYGEKPYGGDSHGEKPYGGDSYIEKPYGGDAYSDKHYGDGPDKPYGEGAYEGEHHSGDHYGDNRQHEHRDGEYEHPYGSAQPYDQEAELVPVAGEVGVTRPGAEAGQANDREGEGEDRKAEGEGEGVDSIREVAGEEREEAPSQLKPSEGEDEEGTIPSRERMVPQAKPILPRSLGDVMFSGSLASQSASGKEMQDPRDARAESTEAEEQQALARPPVGPKSLKDVMLGGGARAAIASVEDSEAGYVSVAAGAEAGPSPARLPVGPESLRDLMHGGRARAAIASVGASGASNSEDRFVSVAATWHPLAGAGGNAGYVKADCAGEKPQCMCGPVLLTVTAQCSLVMYDACDNTLKCSNGAYGGYGGY